MVKNPPANPRDAGSVSGWERSSEGGNGNPLQYSRPTPIDRGSWKATKGSKVDSAC